MNNFNFSSPKQEMFIYLDDFYIVYQADPEIKGDQFYTCNDVNKGKTTLVNSLNKQSFVLYGNFKTEYTEILQKGGLFDECYQFYMLEKGILNE